MYDARLLSFDGTAFELEVSCSKGTYIRTLAEDIGLALGCGAHISQLRRLKTGPFSRRHVDARGLGSIGRPSGTGS